VSNVTAITAANTETFSLTGEGHVYAWGTMDSSVLLRTSDPRTPSAVSLPEPAVRLSEGSGDHRCVVGVSGKTYCWGNPNGVGASVALEPGEEFVNVPTLVPGLPAIERLVQASGDTCGLTRDGALYCWRFDGPVRVRL
jgi:alpha-tubulin suppressor-like RCC1 family protein